MTADGTLHWPDQARDFGYRRYGLRRTAGSASYPKEACDAIYRTLAERYGIVFDVTAVVKADDITAGVQEGSNSGAWTVGIYETGAHDYETLKAAGADYLVPAARDLPELIFAEIQPRLERGEAPGQAP